MPSYLYPSFEGDFDAGRIDLLASPLRVLLVRPDYAPSPEHRTRADVGPWEVEGPGYTAGGKALTGRREEAGWLLADDVLWLRATVRAGGAVIYSAEGGELVGYAGFGRPWESVRGEFVIAWPEGRVLELR